MQFNIELSELAERQYDKIHFAKHRYLFVYRVNKSQVMIEGIKDVIRKISCKYDRDKGGKI